MAFTHRLLQGLATLLFAASLAACGGGGGDSPSDPPPGGPSNPAPNRTPVAHAGSAQSVVAGTRVVLDGSASTDADGDALSYSWTLAAPAGSSASLDNSSAARPGFTPDLAGTYTATLTVSDSKASNAASVVVTASPQQVVEPSIVLDQTEPLSGAVKLSLDGTVTGVVTWYADLGGIGTGNAADGNSITWNTTSLANGAHQIMARIQPASGGATELRRTVTVANSSLTLSARASGTSGTITVIVSARSAFGITRVSAWFDGVDYGSLTQVNTCSLRACPDGLNAYGFTVDAARAGSGPHTMVITATDGSNASRSINLDVPVSNAPVLTVASPAEGALVFGTLRLNGSVTSDKPGALTTTAHLGSVEFLNTQASSFTGSFDLTGLPGGTYTLSVRATDSTGQIAYVQRSVVVTSSSALAHTPVFTLPTGGQLLAADGSQVLYAPGDGSVLLRDLVAPGEVALAGVSSTQEFRGWKLEAGRVVAFGKGADCELKCVYLWSSSGNRTNLTNPNPYSRTSSVSGGWAYDQYPQIHGDYVLWVNDHAEGTGHYTLHRLSTGQYVKIASPAGVSYVGNNEFDFALAGAVVDVWFWGVTGGSSMTLQYDIFHWKSDSQASARITSGGSRHIYPQVDGSRAAWQQSLVGGSADGTFTLVATPVATVAPSPLAEKVINFRLRDGVLAWAEAPSPTSRALYASAGSATRALSILSSAALLANGGGWVVYAEAGRTYSWSAASGTSTLRLDVVPSQTYIAGGAMVFTVGASVYRVGLD